MPVNELGRTYNDLKVRTKENDFAIKSDKEYYIIIGQLLQFYKKRNANAPFNLNFYLNANNDRLLKTKLNHILKHLNFGDTNSGKVLEKCYFLAKEYTPENKGKPNQEYMIGGIVLDLF